MNIPGHSFLRWAGLVALLGLAPMASGQESDPTPATDITNNIVPFKIKVGVDEVRLDAVVLDKKGRVITDLTTTDFEVYQDGVKQEILTAAYIKEPSLPAPRPRNRELAFSMPVLPLKEEEVRRTIIFIVDDISMNFEDVYYARMALRKFVENQMQPGDLVAILRTGYGNSYLNMFLADKKQLLHRIDSSVRWSANAGFAIGGMFRPSSDYRPMIFENQMSAFAYSINALRGMPGRKFMLMLSAQPSIPTGFRKPHVGAGGDGLTNADGREIDFYSRYSRRFNRLADEALRAGVVVHMLDIVGLSTFFAGAENPRAAAFDGAKYGDDAAFADAESSSRGARNPLPLKTGGMYLENSNFFISGIGDVNNLMRGYYMISYLPPATTFRANRKNIYHSVKIKVKRKGATIYTRDGFYGKADEETAPAHPLQAAVFSPFEYRDLDVNLVSGFVAGAAADNTQNAKAPDSYLLRSWVHLDAKDITISDEADGGHVRLETVCLTSNIDGFIHDSRMLQYEFLVKPENIAWIREHGIRFSMLLPVKKPGSYYVRTAVRDEASGKIGSAYQFVEIPDLSRNKALALSNIFVVNRPEDAAWLRTGAARELAQTEFAPQLARDESRSPALRNYVSGDRLQYVAMLYHANAAAAATQVETILYRDGEEVFHSAPVTLVKSQAVTPVVNKEGKPERLPVEAIPIIQKLTLGPELAPGDYTLLLLATDTQKKNKKDGRAVQAMSFTITGN